MARYKRSLDVARKIGVPYTPAAGLAVSPVERIVERFERLDGRDIQKPVEVSAVLGGEDVPPVMLSQMMDELERLSEAALVGKSERQRKRWRTPKETALATFVEAVGGDRPMSTLSRTDVLSFRQRLQDRVVAGE
ncbi:MAG TPA: integrase, partial [Hyphomicrobiaceae bacterium]|nr:integrase [Hyphomicrobiaceae bacterium]